MSMGLPSDPLDCFTGLTVRLQVVKMDKYGYSEGGRVCWGIGLPLYRVSWDPPDPQDLTHFESYFRASDRYEAKKYLRERVPGIKFQR